MKHIETTRLRLRSAGAFFIPEALICINCGRRGCGLHMSEPEKNPKAAGVAGMCKAASIATAAPETWEPEKTEVLLKIMPRRGHGRYSIPSETPRYPLSCVGHGCARKQIVDVVDTNS